MQTPSGGPTKIVSKPEASETPQSPAADVVEEISNPLNLPGETPSDMNDY